MKKTPLFNISERKDGTLVLKYHEGQSERYRPCDAAYVSTPGVVLFRFKGKLFRRD